MTMTSDEFTGTLTRVTAGGTGDTVLEKINRPLDEIETALNTLSSRIGAIGDRASVLRQYVPLSPDCFRGALVYFNPAPGHTRFEPAFAAVLDAVDGQPVEAPSTRVEGMVVSISASSGTDTDSVLGTLLTGGYWDDADMLAACVGSGTAAGTYYLSDSPGRASESPVLGLCQPVISAYGDGSFGLSLMYRAQDGHQHQSHLLSPSAWRDVTEADAAPDGYAQVYDTALDAEWDLLGPLHQSGCAVFLDGVLDTSGAVEIQDGRLFRRSARTGSTFVFSCYPFMYGDTVVRSVVSASPLVKVSRVGGTVRLSAFDFPSTSTSPSPVAVSDLSGTSLRLTPVVSELVAGPGVTVNSDPSTGRATVSSGAMVGTLLDAYAVNHNGTVMSSDGSLLHTVFPAGRTASLTLSVPLSGMSGRTMRARACVVTAGCDVTLSCSFLFLPFQNETTLPVDAATGTITLTGTSGKAVRGLDDTGTVVTGDGMLYITMSPSAVPSSDVRLLRLGAVLEPEA